MSTRDPIGRDEASPGSGAPAPGGLVAIDLLIVLMCALLGWAVVLMFAGGVAIAVLVGCSHLMVSVACAMRALRPAIRRAPFALRPSK